MTTTNHRQSLEEVLDEFFFSADKPSPTMLIRVCEAHPEYREDILEFAALWSMQESTPEPENVTALSKIPEESISRLQSFVLNRLHEIDQKPLQVSDVEAARKVVAELAGGELRRSASAAELGGSTLLLQKVLIKTIKDVPLRVLANLANYHNIALTALQQALADPTAVSRSYSASGKPNAPSIETWEKAVRALSVSEDEKIRLLALQEKEESH